MATLVFDTYLYIKKLREVGFTEEQAAVQAETLGRCDRRGSLSPDNISTSA